MAQVLIWEGQEDEVCGWVAAQVWEGNKNSVRGSQGLCTDPSQSLGNLGDCLVGSSDGIEKLLIEGGKMGKGERRRGMWDLYDQVLGDTSYPSPTNQVAAWLQVDQWAFSIPGPACTAHPDFSLPNTCSPSLLPPFIWMCQKRASSNLPWTASKPSISVDAAGRNISDKRNLHPLTPFDPGNGTRMVCSRSAHWEGGHE